ncbi:MAG: hypothetical protein PHI49_13415 [Halothiobacillaceae bacterium]|nr:hypothetical protein [Halothiobacillaceae bacterium]
MSYAERYRNLRVQVVIIGLLVILGYLVLRGTDAPVAQREVQGTVTEIHTGQAESPRGGSIQMTTARIRIDAETETLLLVPPQTQLNVGDTVALVEERNASGERRYRFAPGIPGY